jgi:hypothetical protein
MGGWQGMLRKNLVHGDDVGKSKVEKYFNFSSHPNE